MEGEEKIKTYKLKNIKYLSILGFINILCVSILWYLVSSGNFLPINDLGEYEWINILIFIFLSSSIIGSLVTVITYFLLMLVFKWEEGVRLAVTALKWGIVISFGLLMIIVLNFFHVLNFYWGIGIFLVIIIISFVI